MMGVTNQKAIRELISESAIDARIKELAEEITRDFEGQDIAVVCLLKGAVMFMSRLVARIALDCTIDFIDISSYHDGTISSGELKINRMLDTSLAGKHVLLIEDIIDTGHTLSYVHDYLKSQRPTKLKLCMLLDKPERRIVNTITPDYVGFVIPNEFVVGFGLDYNQKYRNLPFIGVLDPDQL